MTEQIINELEIYDILERAKKATHEEIERIIEKGRAALGLTPKEAAVLLQINDPELTEKLFSAAREVKNRIYGKRVVIFAPLYISNKCINNCVYCGFRASNKKLFRKTLTRQEIIEQVKILESLGHKRLLIEFGEDPHDAHIDRVVEAIETIYNAGDIRRINVNIAATGVEEYRKLKAARIGTYQLFQETYHRETYEKMHPSGPKSDYDYHLTAHNRAFEAGLDDLGIGVLFGLYDYKFEVVALLKHAEYMDKVLGVGPHTISVPRWRPALGVDKSKIPALVSDDEFKRIVAIIRLAVPYTGIILSTRETAEDRDKLIALGVSQMSAGSCTDVGGYSNRLEENHIYSSQFDNPDHRPPDEVIRRICELGYLPSFCTACYRNERTGERFMKLAKTGKIHNLCQPNAILTFQEYLEDYASPETKAVGEKTIKEQLELIPDPKMKEWTIKRLKRIKQGERDLNI
ncbi:[FeFe] hydrogenase H-cluster radical SAM maturase HydG [Anoxybacter fermentans]|uniref:[FeFe] hydrogenase H-cluster radical SAM maturase HydG n=1 Tax=Anoxybacter fermentans TaxID=1323375 RepID=A0A3S9SZ00_9FIRM|nr:[FeFe] hydrogenase H-cluster radical SAM maturase HydG [Anoxybacter fermentans]AZR73529.1 [FeFe] hydrogenase H-cluster radical SAM maturase HydG [Anoxybacter fermentans]